MSLPVLSLIIPCYNSAATLERTLQSVERQNYPALQLILMDAGSKDGTMEIVQKYQRLFHTIVSEPDRGQAHALNKGFRLATGDLFGWLCADDELMPGALQHVVEQFEQTPQATFLTGGCERAFPDGTRIQTTPPPEMWPRLGYQNRVEQPSTFWRAALHRAAGELDETLHIAFDYEWWNRLKRSGAQPIRTPQILSRYHFSDTSKTSTGGRKSVRELYRVIKQYGPLRGCLADIYLFLYLRFDLHGCYDNPPACGKARTFFFRRSIRLLITLFGRELIRSYNWNFASKQERGLPWWKASSAQTSLNTDPRSEFHSWEYLRHSQRRQEHLASLGLDLAGRTVLETGAGIGDHTSFFLDRGCRVTVTEARAENLAILGQRFPQLEVRHLDLEAPRGEFPSPFDIVYCYGTLYHLKDPAHALAWLARWCGGLLLLETCVSLGDDEAICPQAEGANSPSQAVSGLGCRPTRPWIMRELKSHFPFVYLPATQPWHEQFPLDWTQPVAAGALVRAVFIASRQALSNPILLETLPVRQRRH